MTGGGGEGVPVDGDFDDGALALDDVKFDAHGREGCEDVAEHDDAVRSERPPRLQGQLYGDIGRLRSFPKTDSLRVSAADRPIICREQALQYTFCVV
jgi:hypothetical protein